MKKLYIITLGFLLCSFAVPPKPNHLEVYKEIVSLGIKFPDIAYAQAVLESGAFKSKICLQNNNLFGMRMPMQRKTTAIGKKYGYAKYKTWKDSVKDYKLWQDRIIEKNPSMTRSQYKVYINKIYSTSKNYISKINLISSVRRTKDIQMIIDLDSSYVFQHSQIL